MDRVDIGKNGSGTQITDPSDRSDPCAFRHNYFVALPNPQASLKQMQCCRAVGSHQRIFTPMPRRKLRLKFLNVVIRLLSVPAITHCILDALLFEGCHPWARHVNFMHVQYSPRVPWVQSDIRCPLGEKINARGADIHRDYWSGAVCFRFGSQLQNRRTLPEKPSEQSADCFPSPKHGDALLPGAVARS